jgi:hypothetical protein
MSDEHERDARDVALSRAWSRLQAYEDSHPAEPYATALRLRAATPLAATEELAEALGRHTGNAVSPAAYRQLLERARRKFNEMLSDQEG